MKNSTILTFASQKVHPSIEPDVSCSCFLLAFCAWAYPQLSEGPRALQCRPQIKGCCINIIVLPTLTIGICMPLWSCCGTIWKHSESKTVFPSIQLPVSCSCSLLASFVLASHQLRDPGHCTVDLKARVGCCISLMLRL